MPAEPDPRPPLIVAGNGTERAAEKTLVPSDQTRLQEPLLPVTRLAPPPDEARRGSYEGQQWGDFLLGELIGYGGMGAVYRARQITLDRPVAIKVLGRHLSEDDSFQKRFLREARAVAQINSPNVVQIYSAGTHEGHHFFVMELIAGVDLGHMLHDGFKPSNAQAFDLVLQAARGLSAAGRLGIVHRDIKPANMLLTRDRVLKLTDFGLVKIMAEEGTDKQLADGLTATGIIVGTAGYFSPEQGLGERCDQRTDLYALGVVAFQLLAGRLPFIAEDTTSVIYQHVHEPVPSLRRFNPTVHRALEQVILSCLAKKPADRPQSADELVNRLESIAMGGHISSAPRAAGTMRWALAALVLLGLILLLSVLAVVVAHRRAPPSAAVAAGEAPADAGLPPDTEQRHQALSDGPDPDPSRPQLAPQPEPAAAHAADLAAMEHESAAVQQNAPPADPVASAPTPAHVPPAGDSLHVDMELVTPHRPTYAPLPAQLTEPVMPHSSPPSDVPVTSPAPVVEVTNPTAAPDADAATAPAAAPLSGAPAPAPPQALVSVTGAADPTAAAPAAAATASAPVATPAGAAPVAPAFDTSDAIGRYRDVRILTQTIRFRFCPAGRFRMGSPETEPHRNRDETLHDVVLSTGFWMQETECSQSLWDAVMGYDPSLQQRMACPVDNVSWLDVQLFIRMLNRLTPGLRATLPSEAQWEYAARAAGAPQDQLPLASCAWFSGNAQDQSHPCAALQANAWGLYDCLGNVAEWCNDRYAPYDVSLAIDPQAHGPGAPVIRGGSFRDAAGDCRFAQREHQRASFRSPHLGFRLAALSVPDVLPPPLPATEP